MLIKLDSLNNFAMNQNFNHHSAVLGSTGNTLVRCLFKYCFQHFMTLAKFMSSPGFLNLLI